MNVQSVERPRQVPRPYQVDDLGMYINNLRILNRSEPATGKTLPTCLLFQYVWDYEKKAGLFVSTKSILRKNQRELIDSTDFTLEDTWVFDPLKLPKHKVKVIFVTMDSLKRYSNLILSWLAAPCGLLAGDEWHLYCSTNDSARTQFAYQVMKEIPRFVPMTGTPIRGRMSSAYPMVQLIEPVYYGDYSMFMSYHAEYDIVKRKVTGWRNFEKLETILNHHSINHTFKEIYGEENKVIIPVSIEMGEKQRKLYKQFEEFAWVELNDEEILTAETPGVHTIRCRQILGHPEKFGLAKDNDFTAKDQWIMDEILGGQFKKVMFFSALVPEQERLYRHMTAMGLRVGLINGSTSLDERSRIDEQIQSGDLDFVIASPIAAGVGFNWGCMEAAVYLTIDYMDDSFIQSYRRGIRGARETALRIYLLRYLDSIEYRMWQIIEQKSVITFKVDPSREVLTGLSVV